MESALLRTRTHGWTVVPRFVAACAVPSRERGSRLAGRVAAVSTAVLPVTTIDLFVAHAAAPARPLGVAVGVFLVLYSLYAYFRPALKPVTAGGNAADAAVGFANGMLAGLTGLAGILVAIWSGLRGWPKEAQRAVFQPVAGAIFLMSALWLGAKGTITVETAKLFVLGLPCLIAGTWLGLKLFGRIDEPTFRKIVLALLFVSGASLVL